MPITRKRNNTSGRHGVSWNSKRKKWHAKIQVNYRTINLGFFDDLDLGALEYDDAARKYHGKQAILNFPDRSIDGDFA